MGLDERRPPPRLVVRLCAAFIDLANARPMRHLSVFVLWLGLWLRRVLPLRLLGRAILSLVRMEAACCRRGSPLHAFLGRYLERIEGAGGFERMHDFVLTGPRWRVARRLDAWLRIGLSSTLRHQVLSAHLGTPSVPPRLLTHAQIALTARCDLSCEGCYSAEDRGGRAPNREDMAFLVDEAAACGAFVVHVVGKGEPFLSARWAAQLLAVIEARPHILFTVATHGMRIDASLARRLGSLGNLLLMVAVDGPEPVHDARRGPGAYSKVQDALSLLRAHGVLFGFSCMVSAKSHNGLTAAGFVRAQAAAGCVAGVYSRYFPLAELEADALALRPADSAAYVQAFEQLRTEATIPLIDLDEMESHTGCHARAGEGVYLDGISGRVAPCLRVPFAPDACRVDRAAGLHLADALAHPFFVAYRDPGASCPSWCGASLGTELEQVERLLGSHAAASPRLEGYRDRSAPPCSVPPVALPHAPRPIRRLPQHPRPSSP